MKKLTILLLALISSVCFSQKYADKKVYLIDSLVLENLNEDDKLLLDSCLARYHDAKNVDIKINALGNICENMYDNIWFKYQLFQYKIIEQELTKNSNNKLLKQKGKALNNIGFYLKESSELNKALPFFEQSLKIREEIKDKEGIAETLLNIGYIYEKQGNTSAALDYYVKSMKLFEEIGDKDGLAFTINNIGAIHFIQKSYENALYYFKRSLSLWEEVGTQSQITDAYSNIGSVYTEINDMNQGKEYYLKALKIAEEIQDKRAISNVLLNIGFCYDVEGDFEKAMELYLKVVELQKERKSKTGECVAYKNIGLLKLKQGDLKEAKRYSNLGLELANKIGDPDLIRSICSNLYIIAVKEQSWKEALDMRNLEYKMRDSLASASALKATAQQQAKYEFEKQKALSDVEQAKKDAIAKEEKEKQQIIIYSSLAGVVFLVFFLGFIYNRLKVSNQQKRIIEKQKIEVEVKNHEITQSIQYAQKIQSAILPNEEIFKKVLPNSFIVFKPKDIVSGDFYWLSDREDYIFYATADSTGHGVPGGFMSMLGTALLNEIIDERKIADCGQVLTLMREKIMQALKQTGDSESKDGMDMVLIRIDKKTLEMQYAAANNSFYLIRHCEDDRTKQSVSTDGLLHSVRNDVLTELPCDKMPVGVYHSEVKPFQTFNYQLQKGDTIYTYTDGYADQFGGQKGKKYTYKRLREQLIAVSQEPLSEQRMSLEREFENWKGVVEQVDDVCLIGVKI